MTADVVGETAPGEPPTRGPGSVLVREVAAVPAQAGILREVLADWARQCGLPGDLVADLTLASYEAMANVVEHAYDDEEDGTLTVVATRGPDVVTVTVADTGRWRDADSRPQGGRGLRLIRGLAPDTGIATSPTGTTVRMAWPTTPSSSVLA